jgi:hypothetical protein
LPIAGRAADDHEVALLQPARHLVDVDEAGGEPGDDVLRLRELVDRAEALLHDLAHRGEAGADALLGDAEDRLLGLVEQGRGLVLALVARLHDPVAGVDQVPEDGLLLDDPAPVLDAGDARDAVDERGQVGGAAHRLERGLAHELVLERHQVDRLAALGERGHRVEDAAVRVAVEVLLGQELRGELKAWLSTSTAPSTVRSASWLCGSVRSLGGASVVKGPTISDEWGETGPEKQRHGRLETD